MIVRLQQLNPTIGDLEGNVRRIEDAYDEAAEGGADLLIVPELSVTGYPPMDLLEVDAFRKECFAMSERLILKTAHERGTALLFGNISPNKGSGRVVYNAALLAQNGKLLGVTCKTLLPTYDVFDDLRYFEPNREFACQSLNGWSLGVTICEDIWLNENETVYHTYDVDPLMELKAMGAEVMINLSASPFTKTKHESRHKMLEWNAKRCRMPLLYCNQVGTQTEIVHDGDSVVLDGDGQIVAGTRAFREDYVDVEVFRREHVEAGVEAGVREVYLKEGRNDLLPDQMDRGEEYSDHTRRDDTRSDDMHSDHTRSDDTRSDDMHIHDTRSNDTRNHDMHIHDTRSVHQRTPPYPCKNRRIVEAICSGIRDYFQKTGAGKGAFIGLSGGIDSAIVAVLASEAIGAEKVTGLLMPSGFSSRGSITDAEKLAENLGIQTFQLPIGDLYETALNTLSPVFGDRPFGTAEENLQSRIRGTLLMASANKYGYLLLATGNKSEYAVGYATLYGDMNGALAPIGDLYKTEIYQLSRWLNEAYFCREVIPLSTIEKEPSAELRPDQKDSDSLPPYAQLDRILELAIEHQLGPQEIVEAGAGTQEVVLKVMNLLERSEFKRNQAAPILKLSGKAFGTGRRRPIVQRWRSPGT